MYNNMTGPTAPASQCFHVYSLLLDVIGLFVLARSTDILPCIHERLLRPHASVERSQVAAADEADVRRL